MAGAKGDGLVDGAGDVVNLFGSFVFCGGGRGNSRLGNGALEGEAQSLFGGVTAHVVLGGEEDAARR
jgi:hypothetical protein